MEAIEVEVVDGGEVVVGAVAGGSVIEGAVAGPLVELVHAAVTSPSDMATVASLYPSPRIQ
ncbi:MAG: hypothetical protein OEM22_05125 [Acidimicrobiia bacterium]|nr:hypothetical protein [Acidimicrobiia bacterium]